jgi:predicted  nucleic acid-binding Zn-ribbon protein
MQCKPAPSLITMNIQTLDKQTMDTLKTLAETNVKISEAKGVLLELEASKETFLSGRELEATKRVETVLENSGEILEKIQKNYDESHQLLSTISGFVDFLNEAKDRFLSVVENFDKRQVLWEESVSKHEKTVADIQRKIKVDQVGIETDKKTLKKGWENLEKAEIKLKSDQGLLERNIKRLKEGKI